MVELELWLEIHPLRHQLKNLINLYRLKKISASRQQILSARVKKQAIAENIENVNFRLFPHREIKHIQIRCPTR
ncbi:MAG: hypothetical protein WBA07_08570 [Rivularia sp. (in: cyanobacteria)]